MKVIIIVAMDYLPESLDTPEKQEELKDLIRDAADDVGIVESITSFLL